jgi:hypothetical protein
MISSFKLLNGASRINDFGFTESMYWICDNILVATAVPVIEEKSVEVAVSQTFHYYLFT